MRHFIDVVRSQVRLDHFIAKCSCGWQSEARPRKLDAEMEGDEHLETEHASS